MEQKYIDANIILRFLTGDNLAKQEATAALFAAVEQKQLTIHTPDLVIAEVVYVLSSSKHYHKSREDIRTLLSPLLSLDQLKVSHKKALLRALDMYTAHPIDFIDCYLKAIMEENNATLLYSYDTDFDRFPDLTRTEPEMHPEQKAAKEAA